MSLTENYISIPKKLIADLRDNPFAIALYFFVARLYLVLQAPVPLSRGDIRLFDPSAKVGTVKRALDRLVQAGWLIELPGYKSSYLPTWGKNRAGTPYQWRIGATLLGCPWEVWRDATRVDRALLDVFMGRLTPHSRLAANVAGYFIDGENCHKPLLQLREVGAYMLIAAGFQGDSTNELKRWGLVHDGQAQPIPDDDVVLALASQRASIADFRLSQAAWYRLGWSTTIKNQPEERLQVEAAPLIFVPKERIGLVIPLVIGKPIGCSPFHEGHASASESAQTTIGQNTRTMTGISTDSQESRDTPPNPPMRKNQGGGAITTEEKRNQGIVLPDTEAARTLVAFGVNDPDCLADLATMPLEQVGGAIAYAKTEDLGPGWVVTALRRHRDESWPIPQIRRVHKRDGCIDVAETMANYGDFFRLGSDISGLPTPTSERMSPTSQTRTPGTSANRVPPGAGVSVQARPSDLVQPQQLADTQAPPSWPADRQAAAELTHVLRSRMLMQCERSYHRVINAFQVRVTDTTTVIHCATLGDRLAVLEALIGALRWHIAELGLPSKICVTEQPPPTESEPPGASDPPTNGLPLSA